jgi:hypothetical protein
MTGFVSNTVPFLFLSTMARDDYTSSINPSFGAVSGGTVVVISGKGFLESAKLQCVFEGKRAVAATVTSETSVECEVPASPASGCVGIDVVGEGGMEDVRLGGMQYCYYEAPRVTAVEPTAGHIRGRSAVVTVSGSGFMNHPSLSCRFGEETALAARWLSYGQVVCVGPKDAAGNLSVEVSNNGQDFTVDGVMYGAMDAVNVVSLLPSTGTLDGGSMVTIRTSPEIFLSREASCKFGQVRSELSTELEVGDVIVRCVVPSVNETGLVSLGIYEGESPVTDSVSFRYIPRVRIYDVAPRSGPVSGGTRVTVFGVGLEGLDSEQVLCRFGSVVVATAISFGGGQH